MAKRLKEDPDREARILEAADVVFSEAGYAATSVRAVAERAGVNKALVFYYFRSKERLFEKVLQRYYDSHQGALVEALAGEGALRERLHRMIDTYMDFMAGNVGYARLVQGLVAGSGEHIELIERNITMLQTATTQALDEVTGLAGPLAARQFFVTFSGAVINYFTYAPALASAWEGDPLAAPAVADRREHLHWLIDAIVDRLEVERDGAPGLAADARNST